MPLARHALALLTLCLALPLAANATGKPAPKTAKAAVGVVVPTPAAPETVAPPFMLDRAKSVLTFVFKQAGALTQGRFSRYSVALAEPAEAATAAATRTIAVDVDVASLDTADADRDKTLREADLFDVAKYPRAKFNAVLTPKAGSNEVTLDGTLTLRNVARKLSIPTTLIFSNEGSLRVASMKGEILLNRLDFGVGQGDWKSTEWVDNAVRVRFALRLIRAAAKPVK